MTEIEKRVAGFMNEVVGDYIDCGEVQCTQLAEAAAFDFDIYDEDSNIPEWVFELAFETYLQWEADSSDRTTEET